MANIFQRVSGLIQTAAETGPAQLVDYALYQFQLHSGWLKKRTPGADLPEIDPQLAAGLRLLPLPNPAQLQKILSAAEVATLLAEAEQVRQRQFSAFGGAMRALDFSLPAASKHWTEISDHPADGSDIKDIWEPARFGWVTPLLRAYLLTRGEEYAETFWQLFEEFSSHNPPNYGANWSSAQEVALRLTTLIVAQSVLNNADASTPTRKINLARSVVAHAARIPPSLTYARAQRNNHLLSEALGLYAAGTALAGHRSAPEWRRLGKTWFERAVMDQIDEHGEYIQHSLIYHRLMLQLALWMDAFLKLNQETWSPPARSGLALAAAWLHNHMDPGSGCGPNLGHNDGSNFLPLHPGHYGDLRPVVRAACLAFGHTASLPGGGWDELSHWLCLNPSPPSAAAVQPHTARLNHPNCPSWGILRAVEYHARPAHADQLHVDLWFAGQNIAIDPGTYRYTAPLPWENSLASAFVHNTITINRQEPMQRSGRFRWSRWDQARVLRCTPEEICAERYGYAPLGVLHRRTLTATAAGWTVVDELLPTAQFTANRYNLRLHWLTFDQPVQVDQTPAKIRLQLANCALEITLPEGENKLSLCRAGEALQPGSQIQPHWGWHSKTYALKQPALSIAVESNTPLPAQLITHWILKNPSSER